MRSVTRILLLVGVTGFVATAKPIVIVAGASLAWLLRFNAGCGWDGYLKAWLVRLRWFFLSIILTYGWFTPGAPLLAQLASVSPTWEGLTAGLLRSAALIVILGLVHWLACATSRVQMIGALYWLARPLARVGLDPKVLALRLALVLEFIPDMQTRLGQSSAAPVIQSASRVERLADRAAAILTAVLDEPEQPQDKTLNIRLEPAPAMQEWLGLAALLTFFAMLIRL